VVFRPLATPIKADYWVSWHQENRSKALHHYVHNHQKQPPPPALIPGNPLSETP
jgi:hypothetical protein